MAPCNYCGTAPAIANSHVVPKFLGLYIKKNSPFGHMLNLWERSPQFDLHKGPYLCIKCDNEVFGSWETYYSQKVWPDPLNARSQWGDARAINFFISVAYRYAIHFLATSPITASAPYATYFRDLSAKALQSSSEIGTSLFVYPYVHQPIARECALLAGINHLLNLAVHGESLPREGDLPNAMLVITPKVLVLFCDGDLGDAVDCTMKMPRHLSVGLPFDPSIENTDMPAFLSSKLNSYIGEGQGHQKQLGRWKRLAYGTDKLLNPNKMCYRAQALDQALWDWQKANCRR
jgi:hypothetical protein